MPLIRNVIFLVMLMLPGAEPAAAAKRIALVIGNSDYKETAALPNPRNDAMDMALSLKRLEFEVLEGIDLDKRAMERLIRQFDQAIVDADIAIFFYAGHAMQIAGQNLLLPIDARLSSEGDVDFETLPLSLVLQRMERNAKTSLIFLDACRNNALAQNLARSVRTRSAAPQQGLTEVKTGVGMLIAFSTEPGNVAEDGLGRNSPYTNALLKELEFPGRDLLSTLATVRGAVLRATSNRQKPWEHTSLLGPLILKEAPAAAVAVTPKPSIPSDIPQRTDIAMLPIDDIVFRSAADAPYPANAPGASPAWVDSPVTITLSPVAYAHRTEPGRRAQLLSERLTLQFGGNTVSYKAFYNVEMTDQRCGDRWFCIKSNVGPESLDPGKIIRRDTMYFADGKAPTWRTFVDAVFRYPNSPIKIVLKAQIAVAEATDAPPRELTAECFVDVKMLREELGRAGFKPNSALKPVYLQSPCRPADGKR